MTFNELVGNLKTYEMQIDEARSENKAPEKFLALKDSESDEKAELTEQQVPFITKNFNSLQKEKWNK